MEIRRNWLRVFVYIATTVGAVASAVRFFDVLSSGLKSPWDWLELFVFGALTVILGLILIFIFWMLVTVWRATRGPGEYDD